MTKIDVHFFDHCDKSDIEYFDDLIYDIIV